MEYLFFRLGEFRFALEISEIGEIVLGRSVGFSNRSALGGLDKIKIEGREIPLVNLSRRLLRFSLAEESPKFSLLICNFNGKPTALVVDAADEIRRLEEGEIKPLEVADPQINVEPVDGLLRLDDSEIYVIAPGKLGQLLKV